MLTRTVGKPVLNPADSKHRIHEKKGGRDYPILFLLARIILITVILLLSSLLCPLTLEKSPSNSHTFTLS